MIKQNATLKNSGKSVKIDVYMSKKNPDAPSVCFFRMGKNVHALDDGYVKVGDVRVPRSIANIWPGERKGVVGGIDYRIEHKENIILVRTNAITPRPNEDYMAEFGKNDDVLALVRLRLLDAGINALGKEIGEKEWHYGSSQMPSAYTMAELDKLKFKPGKPYLPRLWKEALLKAINEACSGLGIEWRP